jgi:NTE family protein
MSHRRRGFLDRGLKKCWGPILLAWAVFAAGCAYPTRNAELKTLDQREGYRWPVLNADEETLVIVTASGGGTRAAALELSVLQGMRQIATPGGSNLADSVDVISSVSGGSVTAAYFAFKGSGGFGDLEQGFIRKDGIGALLWRALNPVGLAELATPRKERIDLLIDYLDDRLFQGATFQALLDRRRPPYLILNAADMVEGIPFSFTQYNFDLLCSDLRTVKLSTAVAASAAFPVALSPVTLKNYSPCQAQRGPAWPPPWVRNAAGTNWYDNPVRAARGRVATAYALGANASQGPKQFIHLLDGGTAENLGVSEPYRLLTTVDVAPSFLTDISQGRVKRIVFIMINARSFATSRLDQQQATPGALDGLLGTISSGIDQTTFGTADRLRELLSESFVLQAKEAMDAGAPAIAANFNTVNANTFLIPIDFDALDDPDCRQRFHNIGTSWTLESKQIDALLVIGKALLFAAPNFQPMLQSVQARVEGPAPSIADACAAISQG